MSLPLKVNIVKLGQSKTFRFGPTMSVSEACKQIKEKSGEGGDDHGMFQQGDPSRRIKPRWLRPDRTLQFYDLRANDEVDYKKKHRPAKVRLLDGTNKTVLIDDSATVGDTVMLIGSKIKLSAPEEFGLQAEKNPGKWLITAQTLHEQDVNDEDGLVLKKRFFVTDDQVGKDDPVQLQLVYVQAREQVLDGTHACTQEEAISFAAMQCQVDLGNYNAAIHKPGTLKVNELLPPNTLGKKDKPADFEKRILAEYKKLTGTTEVNAKYRYVQLCRSLKTYGITFFPCMKAIPNKKPGKPPRMQNLLMGVSKSNLTLTEPTTKEDISIWKVEWMKRWAASGNSLTIDFGEHENEFVVVQTEHADEISQLISGYIDILFKRSKDQGVYLDDDDAETGTIESLGRIRGQAAAGYTSSTVGGHQAMHGKVSLGAAQSRALMIRRGVGESQQIEITDMPSAIAHINQRVEAIPKEFSRSTSALSPKQWSEQLGTNFGALAAAAGKLQDFVNAGGNLDRNQMNNYAREIAMAVGNMLSSARNASQGQPEDDMPLFDAAKAVSEAIKNILQASQDMADNPNDPMVVEAWRQAQESLKVAGLRLESAKKGALVDDGAKRLLLESAKAVAAATKAMCGEAEGAADGLSGPARDRILQAAKMLGASGDATTQIAQILAPVMLEDAAKQNVEESATALKRMAAALLAAAKEGGIDIGQMESLNNAAKLVNDALAQLLSASMTAEERLESGDREFANAANDILHGTAVMLSAKGKPQVMQDQAQKILAASGRLIQATKKMATNAPDEATKNRLLACAKRVADATRTLMNNANTAAQHPNDEAAWSALANSSRQVGEATRLLVGDATKETALKSLRTNAKKAAADTTTLLTAAQIAAASIRGTPEEQNLLTAAQAAAEALKNLINATAHAAQNPDDIAANQQLTESARQVGPAVFGLVNAAKQGIPKMTDDQKKNDLVHAANAAGTSVKTMLESMQQVLAVAGVAEIEEALEVFEATAANVESALMFAESGGLEADGSTREQALEGLNGGVKALAAATKEIATLKDNPQRLGPASKNLADAVAITVNSSKSVAANTKSRAAQKQILGAAKHLNAEGTKLAKAARAVVENPNDPELFNVLSRAVKDTADALQALIASSKGAEPGAREVEQALRTLKEETAKLGQGNPSGDFKKASDELTAVARALGAASQNLTGTAKNNPPGLGAAVNAVKQTIPPLIGAANKAAADTTDAAQKQQIISSVGGLAQNLGALLQKSRQVASKPDDTQAQLDINELNKNVASSVKKVMDAISTATPAQRKMLQAVEDAMESTRGLNQAGRAKNAQGKEYEAIMASSKAVAAATSEVVKATMGGNDDQTAASADALAQKIDMIVEYTKAAAAKGGQVGDDALSDHAHKVKDAAQQLHRVATGPTTPQSRQQIVEAAKIMAAHTSGLVGAARSTAAAVKDSNPQAHDALMAAGKGVAEKTGALVESAKVSAANPDQGKDRLAQTSQDLIKSIDALVAARPADGAGAGNYDPSQLGGDPEQLVNASKGVGSAATQLLSVANDVVGGKKTAQQAQPQLAAAAKAVTNALMAVNNASTFLKPGAKDLEYAVNKASEATNGLQDSALNAAIGMLDNTAPPGATYQQMQETMVNVAKEIAASVKDFVIATKGDPAAVGAAARKAGDLMTKLQKTAEAASSTTTDQQRQQDGLEQAKTITDAVLGLLQAARAGDGRMLGAQAKSSSEAIQGFLEYLRGGVMGMREVDDAVTRVRNETARLDTDLGSVNKNANYNQCQENLQNVAKQLAGSLNNLTKVAKQTPDQLGQAANQVADVMPGLVNGALETAASTPEESARGPLLSSTKNIAQGTADLVENAKLVAADPSNALHANNMSKSFGQVTSNIRDFIKAVKEGNVGEAMINQAIESVGKTMAHLDQSSLYAAAGQLESDAESQAAGEKALADQLIQVAKGVAGAAAQMVNASAGTPDQAGGAAQNLAKTLDELATKSSAMASMFSDPTQQQNVLEAARGIAENSENLLNGCKDGADKQTLSGHTAAISDSLKKLVGAVQAATQDTNRGLAELDRIRLQLEQGLQSFVNPSNVGNSEGNTDMVVNDAKAVAEAISEIVENVSAGTVEELLASCNNLVGAQEGLFNDTKGAVKHEDAKPEVVESVNAGVEATGNAVIGFVDAVKAHKDKPNPDTQRKLSETAGIVVDKINDVVEAASQLPGGANAEAIFRGGDDLEDMAERELLNAAAVIEEAAAALLKAKKRRLKQPDVKIEGEDLVGAVLEAAQAIAEATGNLVRAATVVQKELVATGRATNEKVSVYKKDPAWAKGLISAAKSVAGSVQLLVTGANNAAAGNSNESELVAAARGVAAATARLVSASRSKADPMSESLQKLSNCAKAVASSTAQLVQAAKEASAAEEEDSVDYGNLSAMQKKRMEMEQLAQIEALEKQLQEEERRLKQFHRAEYQQARRGNQ